MNLIHKAGIAMFLTLTPPLVVGQAGESRLKSMTVDELKSLYLACDRAAVQGVLGAAAIAQCSVVYEELKRQAFDGDFEKLLAWSSLHPSVRSTAR